MELQRSEEPVRTAYFIADDLGMSVAVNEAILYAHVHGALDGASLMVGQPGTSAAAAAVRATPSLEVGWHVHLLDSRPCTLRAWPWGDSPAAAGAALGCSRRMRRLARAEIAAQWEEFCDTGLQCRFVNAHHHLHVHPFVRRTLMEVLPSDFDGWIRWGRPRFFGQGAARFAHLALHAVLQAPQRAAWPFPVSATLWGLDRTFAMRADEVAAVLPRLGDGLHELLFHPRSLHDPDTTCLLELRSLRP